MSLLRLRLRSVLSFSSPIYQLRRQVSSPIYQLRRQVSSLPHHTPISAAAVPKQATKAVMSLLRLRLRSVLYFSSPIYQLRRQVSSLPHHTPISAAAVPKQATKGVRLQKLHKNWDEDPNIGFMVVEGSLSMSTDPSYEQGRPCKSVVELGHIIDRGRRVTQLESSSSVLKHCHFKSYLSLTKAATAIQKHPCSKDKFSRSFSTSIDKFPMETVLGLHKDPEWRPLVESFRNVAVYGDITTTVKEMILINTGSSKETIGNVKGASIYCTWKNHNINLVHLPLEDKYSLNRALRVIDGAILVLCAVFSVYNRDVDIHMRKNGIARVVFIENLDKVGADPWRVINEVRVQLKLRCAALQIPIGLGSKFHGFIDIVERKAHYFHHIGDFDIPQNLQGLVSGKRRELMKLLSKVDQRFMMDTSSDLKEAIRRATVARQFVPAFIGVASEYKSVQSLLDGILDYLPCPLEVNVAAIDHDSYEKKVTLSGNPEGSLVGLVFSSEDCLEDDKHFPKSSYIRLYEGKIRKGSRIVDVLTEEDIEIELYRVTSDGPKDVEYAVAGDIVVTSGVYFEPGETLTDGTVNYTIPCTRGLSLRPIEIGEFHKLFSPILEDCGCFMIGESLHGASIKTGLELAMRHNLLSLYCTNKKFESVEKVLKFTDDFNRKLLNSLIHGFAKTKPMYSLVCFRKLLHVGPPTDVTYRGIIRAYRRMKLKVGWRVLLVDIIMKSMTNDEVVVDRRHRAGLVDMLLGGGLVDQAYEQMKKDNLQADEKLIISFLHTYTAYKYADGTIVDEKVSKKNIEKCQQFVSEMEDNGIQYTIYTSLRDRLKEKGINLGSNVVSIEDKDMKFGYGRSFTHEDLDNQVLVEGSGCSRTAILNRPPVNALTTHMGYRLQKLYKNWEEDPNIGFVMMKGSGKAFCAGGDIVSLYHLRKKGSPDAIREFFWSLYSFIYLLGTYLKPHVAILNGVTMGGGAGVSIPGMFRVATDRTIFATPETIIGFHPDAGASFNLSHLPGRLGEYLGLTGLKLSGAEMLACGLATHYMRSEEVPVMEEQLKKLLTDDPSVVESSLKKCSEVAHPVKTGVLSRIDLLEKCFGHDTVEEIIDSLEIEASRRKDTWCMTTLRRLKETSPLSLKVALRSIREGRFQTLDQCLIREYRMSLQGTIGPMSSNFCEGVRARLIDKDEAPKWDPPSLEKVSEDMVDNYFSALTPTEPDLDLP